MGAPTAFRSFPKRWCGWASPRVSNASARGQGRRAVIGKDTRLSGYMIESALISGLVATGMIPLLIGPLPTLAIAMLARAYRAEIAFMVTASHNPYDHNGVKIFDSDGAKIDIARQARIEARLEDTAESALATPGNPWRCGESAAPRRRARAILGAREAQLSTRDATGRDAGGHRLCQRRRLSCGARGSVGARRGRHPDRRRARWHHIARRGAPTHKTASRHQMGHY